jgi:hypothetical protein
LCAWNGRGAVEPISSGRAHIFTLYLKSSYDCVMQRRNRSLVLTRGLSVCAEVDSSYTLEAYLKAHPEARARMVSFSTHRLRMIGSRH